MRKLLPVLTSLMVATGTLFAGGTACLAEGESISMSASSASATVGSTVTVSVGFNGSEGSVYTGSLSYDAGCLQPVSASSGSVNLGNNSVVFSEVGSSFSVTFQVIGAGNASVGVNGTAANSMSGTTQEWAVGNATGISCLAAQPETVAPTQAPPETAAPTPAPETAAPTQAPQTAAPTQAPQTAAPTQTPTTASTQPAVSTQEAATDQSADIAVQSEELRQAALEEESTEESSAAESEEENSSEELNIATSLDGVALPEGAEQITYNYHGNVIYIARTAEGLNLLPVVGSDGGIIWYVYNETTDEAIRYARFSNMDESFVIISPDDDVEIPEEFVPVKISLEEGVELPAWKNPLLNDDAMYFIYAMNSKGEKGFYRFDGSEGLLVRYVEDVLQTEETTTVEQTNDPELVERASRYQNQYEMASSQIDSINQENEKNMLVRALIIIGLGAVSLVFLLIIALMGSSLRKRKKLLRAAEERADEAENMHRAAAGNVRRRQRDLELFDDEDDDEAFAEARPAAREEGTSSVRRVRSVERTDNEAFARNRAYDETVTAVRTRQPERRPRTGEEPVRRRPAADGEVRRSAEGTQRRRPAEGTQARRPESEGTARRPESTAQTRRPADGAVRRRPAADGQEPVRRRVPAEGQAPAKRRVPTDGQVRRTASEGNVTESVKMASRQKPVRRPASQPENLPEEDADFDLTDFKNI